MQTFWREVAPCSHVVQIYEDQEGFLNLLEGFVAGGIAVGDCVIVIAQAKNRSALAERLASHGYDVEALMAKDQYIALDAEETLAQFMVDDWPDYHLFMNTISAVFQRAHQQQRQVRAFGEMVAVLWAQGKSGATVMLEYLWNTFSEKEKFPLFCAYPKSGFTQDTHSAIKNICSTHSQMVTGSERSKTEICYQPLV